MQNDEKKEGLRKKMEEKKKKITAIEDRGMNTTGRFLEQW